MAYKQSAWEKKFLELYKATGNVSLSAYGSGTARSNVYARREDSPEFAARMDAAHIEAVETLEAEAWNRARKTSDVLLIFLLKALKPQMYRENIKVTLEYNLSAEQINRIAQRLVESGIPEQSLGDAFEEFMLAYVSTESADTERGAPS